MNNSNLYNRLWLCDENGRLVYRQEETETIKDKITKLSQ